MQPPSKGAKTIGIIILLQVFDIAIHAATHQLEPLRVVSNLVILAWIALMMTGKLGEILKSVALGAMGAYLGLTVIFVALEGVTNPKTGALRGMLFLLVLLTTALSTLLYTQLKKS